MLFKYRRDRLVHRLNSLFSCSNNIYLSNESYLEIRSVSKLTSLLQPKPNAGTSQACFVASERNRSTRTDVGEFVDYDIMLGEESRQPQLEHRVTPYERTHPLTADGDLEIQRAFR
jgi:hypothetical protein